ncbi:hypothetical protein CAPTEDRAFT_152560 [Capitella teleta]|uniref:Ribosomal protein L7/L12 C-terminal domain-containing protein n=1 Tax=Capitella teleta TaxID=283909 RepID=R7TGV0_CAPTE|nr:hypothetical protein CAPTEDRAFT_152560 [Capitella teleta]|eukprot:ELT92717.1 hypothetical protein CAPTEDRAFT_152560 [Capitella teleta]
MQSTSSKLTYLIKFSQRLSRLSSSARVQTSRVVPASFVRLCSADAAIAPPHVEGADKTYPPKIHKIVEDISQLTLIEVADLNALLKKTLNIADAPVMSMSAVPNAAGAGASQEEAVEEKPVEKMAYKVRLTKFDTAKKVALIKQIKGLIEGMNLVQAKKFVESVPTDVKSDLSKVEAEELQKLLEGAGGTVELI